MLVPGRLACPVVEQRLASDTELRTDEGEHRCRDRLAGLGQTTGMTKSAELEREAEPVLRSTPATDMNEVSIAQGDLAPYPKRPHLRHGSLSIHGV